MVETLFVFRKIISQTTKRQVLHDQPQVLTTYRQTESESRERRAPPLQDQHALVRTLTCAVTHALVSDNVLVL